MIGNKLILIITSLFVLVILFGCTQLSSSSTKDNNLQEIKCPVLDYSNCPQQKCPQLDCSSCQIQNCETQIQTITKYQCFDGTVKDSKDGCPSVVPVQNASIKTFNGTNGQVTKQFYLQPGLAIFYAKNTGKSNFIVHLLDEDGVVAGLINVIGAYDGSVSATVPAEGYYRLEIELGATQSGTWEITVEQ